MSDSTFCSVWLKLITASFSAILSNRILIYMIFNPRRACSACSFCSSTCTGFSACDLLLVGLLVVLLKRHPEKRNSRQLDWWRCLLEQAHQFAVAMLEIEPDARCASGAIIQGTP